MLRSPPPHLFEGGRAGERTGCEVQSLAQPIRRTQRCSGRWCRPRRCTRAPPAAHTHRQGSPSADQVAGLPAGWMVSERAQSTSATAGGARGTFRGAAGAAPLRAARAPSGHERAPPRMRFSHLDPPDRVSRIADISGSYTLSSQVSNLPSGPVPLITPECRLRRHSNERQLKPAR